VGERAAAPALVTFLSVAQARAKHLTAFDPDGLRGANWLDFDALCKAAVAIYERLLSTTWNLTHHYVQGCIYQNVALNLMVRVDTLCALCLFLHLELADAYAA